MNYLARFTIIFNYIIYSILNGMYVRVAANDYAVFIIYFYSKRHIYRS